MKSVRRRLTFANVMSSIAVFLVVAGGTAFAASQLGKESIGTKQLKKEAVTPAKLSVAAKATLTGPQGATGATGAQGAKGDKGEKGEKGASGTAGIHEVVVQKAIGASTTGVVMVECPSGEVATGGGGNDGGNTEAVMYQNAPLPSNVTSGSTPTGWQVYWKTGTTAITAYAYALCATP